MSTNIQLANDKLRAVYELCPKPLLAQLVQVHRISIREFAEIMDISKSHCEEVINHRKMPSMELGLKMARYFEVTVEELFGWRVYDTGERRPLLFEVNGEIVRLKARDKEESSIAIIRAVAANTIRDVENLLVAVEAEFGERENWKPVVSEIRVVWERFKLWIGR